MAFVAITNAEIAAGQPNKQELWDKVQDNFDDHETRITANEAATANTTPICFFVKGEGFVTDNAAYIKLPFNMTFTGIEITVMEDGGSGTYSVDVQKKRGAGAFATILTANLSLASGGGNFSSATGTLSDTDGDADDILRLDIDTIQTGARDFVVSITYDPA